MDIVSLDNLRVISDTAPFEPSYTGDNLIVEKDGKYGLVRAYGGDELIYRWVVLPKETHIKHWSFLTRTDVYVYVFTFRNEKGKLALFLNNEHYQGGYRFEEISYLENSPSTAIIKGNGHFGYLDMERETIEYHIELVLLQKDDKEIDWHSLDWLGRDIKLQNKQGKWAVYSAALEPMTGFVFNNEPEYTRFGTYQYKKRGYEQE